MKVNRCYAKFTLRHAYEELHKGPRAEAVPIQTLEVGLGLCKAHAAA